MMTITVGTVDMDGYCGREFHPEPTDAGRKFSVVCVTTINAMDAADFDAASAEDAVCCAENAIHLFHCVDATGRKVEFVDHEVAKVEC